MTDGVVAAMAAGTEAEAATAGRCDDNSLRPLSADVSVKETDEFADIFRQGSLRLDDNHGM